MSDRIKVNYAAFQETVQGIDDFCRRMEEHKGTIQNIKNTMMENWTGEEADKAYAAIGNIGDSADTIFGSINRMIEIQKNIVKLFNDKIEGFASAKMNF